MYSGARGFRALVILVLRERGDGIYGGEGFGRVIASPHLIIEQLAFNKREKEVMGNGIVWL